MSYLSTVVVSGRDDAPIAATPARAAPRRSPDRLSCSSPNPLLLPALPAGPAGWRVGGFEALPQCGEFGLRGPPRLGFASGLGLRGTPRLGFPLG